MEEWDLLEKLEEVIYSGSDAESVKSQMLHTFDQIESSSTSELLIRQAKLLSLFATHFQRPRFFRYAIDKLKAAQGMQKSAELWHLWGTLLTQLATVTQQSSLVEEALEKFELADSLASSLQLYWDWGCAWVTLGKQSTEIFDFSQALAKFDKAAELLKRSFYFRVDWCEAQLMYAQLRQDHTQVEQTLDFLEKSLAHEVKGSSFERGWVLLAQGAVSLYQMRGREEDFRLLDQLIEQAILQVPDRVDLWLLWAEAYLEEGWVRRDEQKIEKALDKLCASKVGVADPFEFAALMGQALLFMGLFSENLKLLDEGHARIEDALELCPENPRLLHAMGVAQFCEGLYFGEKQALCAAQEHFQRAIAVKGNLFAPWFGLFQCCHVLGQQFDDPFSRKEGLRYAMRCCSLRQNNYWVHNLFGEALYHISEYEEDPSALIYLGRSIEKYKHALRLCATDEQVRFNLGRAFLSLAQITAERDHYERAIEIFSSLMQPGGGHISICYHLGLALSHRGAEDEDPELLWRALDLFKAIVMVEEEDESVWHQLGFSYLCLSQLCEAEEEGQHLCEAEKALLEALELGCSPANFLLGCLYSLSGMVDQSIHYLKRAQKVGELPEVEELEREPWLAKVREVDLFYQLFMVGR